MSEMDAKLDAVVSKFAALDAHVEEVERCEANAHVR